MGEREDCTDNYPMRKYKIKRKQFILDLYQQSLKLIFFSQTGVCALVVEGQAEDSQPFKSPRVEAPKHGTNIVENSNLVLLNMLFYNKWNFNEWPAYTNQMNIH